MTTYRIHKGIYYFSSYENARAFAEAGGYPTDRIISYGLGWAIQLRVSGPYVCLRLHEQLGGGG